MKATIFFKIVVFVYSLCAVYFVSASENENIPTKNAIAWIYSTSAEFDEVKEDLILAIQSQGAVISYTAHASKMLERTSKATQAKEKIYHKAEVLLFCKAELSHIMAQQDPHGLVLCPYPIAIYSLASDPNVTYLSIKTPPKNMPTYDAVHKMLIKIVNEAIDF